MGQAQQAQTVERLVTLLTAPVEALGFDLEDVEVTPAGKRRIVRVAVDQDGGVTLDDIAEATRAVSKALDATDVLGERPYTLEVSSRGVDRPLTLPRHWRRNVDRLVRVTRTDGDPVEGRIVGVDEPAGSPAVVRVREHGPRKGSGKKAGAGPLREIPLADIKRALVQIEFNARKSG